MSTTVDQSDEVRHRRCLARHPVLLIKHPKRKLSAGEYRFIPARPPSILVVGKYRIETERHFVHFMRPVAGRVNLCCVHPIDVVGASEQMVR